MFINCLWFIEQAWETVFKPFTMKICEVIWIFANDLWKTGSWKGDVSFYAEFRCKFAVCIVFLSPALMTGGMCDYLCGVKWVPPFFSSFFTFNSSQWQMMGNWEWRCNSWSLVTIRLLIHIRSVWMVLFWREMGTSPIGNHDWSWSCVVSTCQWLTANQCSYSVRCSFSMLEFVGFVGPDFIEVFSAASYQIVLYRATVWCKKLSLLKCC